MKTTLNIKEADLEGKIFIANSLFAENGAFPDYQEYTKISEFEEIEGTPLQDEDLHRYQKFGSLYQDAETLEDYTKHFKYYTWMDGYVITLFPFQAEYEVDKELTDEKINTALENIYKANEYIKELVDIATTEF